MSLKRVLSDYMYAFRNRGKWAPSAWASLCRCENGAPARDPIIGEHEENNHMVVTAIDICFRKRINDSLLLVPAR